MPPQYIPAENVDQVHPRKDYLVYRDGTLRRIEKANPVASNTLNVAVRCDDDTEGSSDSIVELSFAVKNGIIRIDPAIGISRYD